MKIILSRKGVDSSAGGFASPIMPDGTLLPIAIPDKRSPIKYNDVRGPVPIGRLVKHLSKNRIHGRSRVHLDPDLTASNVERNGSFQSAFGQCGAAQSHLASHKVTSGDLFIFFGWYRQVEHHQKRWRYVPGAPDLHVIFGWLQIAEMVTVDQVLADGRYQSLRSHPHCFGNFSGSNVLYIGSKKLLINNRCAGSGTFASFSRHLVLTADNSSRSLWRVPNWMHPRGRSSTLSYHQDLSRWQKRPAGTLLKSAARGQEFVLDVEHYPECMGWLSELFEVV